MVVPISFALSESAVNSAPVAPDIADTFAIPCSNCIPVLTTSLPKLTACRILTNAPTATAALEASEVMIFPVLLDCEPKVFMPVVVPFSVLLRLLLALMADFMLVKKLPLLRLKVAPIFLAITDHRLTQLYTSLPPLQQQAPCLLSRIFFQTATNPQVCPNQSLSANSSG